MTDFPVTRRGSLGALSAASHNRFFRPNGQIGIGVIGYGLIATQHIGVFKKLTDLGIVGLSGTYEPRVEQGLAYIGNSNTKGYINRAIREANASRREEEAVIVDEEAAARCIRACRVPWDGVLGGIVKE